MSIDLILRADTRQALVQWGRTHGLQHEVLDTPAVIDPETGEETSPATYKWEIKPGLDFAFWGGQGRFMTSPGTYDQDGTEITPPSYASGIVVILRIHHEFFNTDHLTPDPDDPDAAEQWARSKVVRYIKNNGTPGTQAGMTYYEFDGVRVYRPSEVYAFCAANNVPTHTIQ